MVCISLKPSSLERNMQIGRLSKNRHKKLGQKAMARMGYQLHSTVGL